MWSWYLECVADQIDENLFDALFIIDNFCHSEFLVYVYLKLKALELDLVLEKLFDVSNQRLDFKGLGVEPQFPDLNLRKVQDIHDQVLQQLAAFLDYLHVFQNCFILVDFRAGLQFHLRDLDVAINGIQGSFQVVRHRGQYVILILVHLFQLVLDFDFIVDILEQAHYAITVFPLAVDGVQPVVVGFLVVLQLDLR